MPTPIYCSINEGGIAGSVEIAGREDTIEVLKIDHNVSIPTDQHTGRSRGVRVHSPFKFIKAFDASSPYLYKACTEGQAFDTVKFSFYEIDETGAEVEYFTIMLEEVRVAKVRAFMPNVKDSDGARYPHMEEVEVTYRAITWTYTDGTLEHQDDWLAAR